MIEWYHEFESGNVVYVVLALLAVLVLLGPGQVMYCCGLLQRRNPVERSAQWLQLCACLSLAWGIWIYSLGFGPSWGTVPKADPSEVSPVELDLRVMQELAEHEEVTIYDQGKGGWIGGPEYFGFETLGPHSGDGSPVFPTRPPAYEIPHVLFMFFQMAVFISMIAPLCVQLQNRLQQSGLTVFAILWGTCVYAPVIHWHRGGGWLASMEALDSLGGLLFTAVGCSALTVSLLPGSAASTDLAVSGSSSPVKGMAGIGAGLVWAGLLSMNAAGFLAEDGRVSVAILNCHIAVSTAVLTSLGADKFFKSRRSSTSVVRGVLAGTAAIASGSGLMQPQSALIVGAVAGVLTSAVALISVKDGRRDGLLIFASIGGPGIAGLLLTGIFTTSSVAGFDASRAPIEGAVGGNAQQLTTQVTAAISVAAVSAIGTALAWTISKLLPQTEQTA